MHRFALFSLLLLSSLAMLVACSDNSSSSAQQKDSDRAAAANEQQASTPAITAASLQNQVVLTTDEYLSKQPYSTADRDNGRSQAQICRACHTFEAGGASMIGPALNGMFGRDAGGVPEFRYSKALAEAKFVWTPEAMTAWLMQPADFLPGNSMMFAGVNDAQDRIDLVTFLLVETSKE